MERLPLLLLVVLSCAGTTVDPPQPPTLEELPAANLKAANATISPRPGPAMSADPLDVWLERLIQVESGGRPGLTIQDQNGRLSRGCLQFQDLTLIAYARKYGFFPNVVSIFNPSESSMAFTSPA